MVVDLIKFADRWIGTPLCYALYLADKFRKNGRNTPKKILVILFWGIGSNVNSLPAIKVLKSKFPKSKITVLAPLKNKELFYGADYIDKMIYIDIGIWRLIKTIFRVRGRFDLVIDMEHWMNISAIISFFAAKRRIGFYNTTRSILYNEKVKFDRESHAVVNNLKLLKPLGIDAKVNELVKLGYSDADKGYADGFLKTKGIGRKDFVVGVCPGSGATVMQRRWLSKRFAEAADRLIELYKAKIIFVGSNDEKKLIKSIIGMMKYNAVDASGSSLGKLIALVDNFDLMISNDTGPMHIAAAQGVKTIGLFGPETPVIFGPYGKKNIGLFKGVKCSPCIKVYKGGYRDCDDNICMKAISVDDVLGAVRKIVGK